MADCLLALGSNLGDRSKTLDAAAALLAEHPDMRLVARSEWRATVPVGGESEAGEFLNGAVRVETSLPPEPMLEAMQRIETALGRSRRARWSARTLDLDLLLYAEEIVETPNLVLPHPRMAFRRFVLESASEVAAEMKHPRVGWNVARLLAHLNTSPNYLAIAGPIASGKTQLAEALHERFGGHIVREPLDEIDLARFFADPKARGYATEMELMRRRGEALRRGSPPAAAALAGEFLVSDYWFGQSLAYARTWLGDAQIPTFEEAFRDMEARVVPPRLIVYLRATPEATRDWIAAGDHVPERDLSLDVIARLNESLERHIVQAGHGPVLMLDAAHPEVALFEAAAAVEAMQ